VSKSALPGVALFERIEVDPKREAKEQVFAHATGIIVNNELACSKISIYHDVYLQIGRF
jgi:hypothetical protein